MKRFIKFLFAFGLVFSLAGCGGGVDEEPAVKQTVEDYIAAYQAGDLTKSNEYVTEESGLVTSDDEMEKALGDLDNLGFALDDNTKAVFKELLDKIVVSLAKNVYKETEIGSVEIDGDTAEVVVKVTGMPLDELTEEAGEALGMELGETLAGDWIEEHQEEATAYLQSHTEEEFLNWFLQQVLPTLTDELDTVLGGMESETNTQKFTLKKVDGKWLIDNIQEAV